MQFYLYKLIKIVAPLYVKPSQVKSFYPLRKNSTGLTVAARIVWEDTVKSALAKANGFANLGLLNCRF